MRHKCSSVILLNNEDGNFLSKAVRFFTHSDISHTDFTLGNLVREESVLSAQALVTVLPLSSYFANKNFTFTIYTIEDVDEATLERWATEMFVHYAGKPYGILQLLWFIYRWAAEKLGLDVRKGHNWFPESAVCSELVYELLRRVGEHSSPRLLAKLDEWNANTVSPEDIKQIVLAFPVLFRPTTMSTKADQITF